MLTEVITFTLRIISSHPRLFLNICLLRTSISIVHDDFEIRCLCSVARLDFFCNFLKKGMAML